MTFSQLSNVFGQSNPSQTSNLFPSSNNSLPSGGFPSMGQNTPFQFNGTFSGPVRSVSQQTQSALVNGAFAPTANTTTSGGAGTIRQFGVASGNFGFSPSIWANSATSPSTSVFEPSSTAITTGQLSQPSTTFTFGPSSSPALTTGLLPQPSTTFTFGTSSSPALTTSKLSQPATTFSFGTSSGQLSKPSTTFPFGPSSSPIFTNNPSPFQTTTVPSGRNMRSMNGTRVTAYARTINTDNSSSHAEWLTSISAMPTYKEKSHEELKWEDYQIKDKLSQPATTFPFGPSSSSTFTDNRSPFQTMNVPSEAQTMRSPNGKSWFMQSTDSGMPGGTRVAAYAPTSDTDTSSFPAGWLTSISAMPTYRLKSHEELKWEDYQIKDKDKGLNSPMQNTSLNKPFSSIPSNIFTPNSTIPGSHNSSLFPPSGLFPTNSTVSQPLSSPASVPFSTNSTVSQPLSSPTFVPFSTNSIVSQPLSSPAFVPFSTNSTAAFVPFSTNSGFLNNLTCTPSLTPPKFPNSNICTLPSTEVARNSVLGSQSLCPTCKQVNPAQLAPSGFSFIQPTQNGETSETISKTNSAPNGFETLARVANQNIFSQMSAVPVTEEKHSSHVMSPLVTQTAAMPQLSFDRYTSSPIQHGISSMPVTNKPTTVKIPRLVITRYLSRARGKTKWPARRNNRKTDGQKVPFFSEEEELPRPPNADAYFNPRDNPRAWIAGTISKADKNLQVQNRMNSVNDIGNTDNCIEEHVGNLISHVNITNDDESDVEYISTKPTNRESCDTAAAHEQDTDVDLLMPKLQNSEYYTEPSIENLAAMEKAEPGFCSRVKDFVVGNYTYGCIKFPGETDVRNLDLESIIQFNNREVTVYKDDTTKPPVGQGLNKIAEVTLLNVTCLDKKTGKPCMDEAKIDKYKTLLTKKAKEQGAEFLSFNPARGEWKFSVPHFG